MSKCVAMRCRGWWRNLKAMSSCVSCLDDNGVTRGVVVMDLFNLKLKSSRPMPSSLLQEAVGSFSRNRRIQLFVPEPPMGGSVSQGMKYANGEFIQIHPTAIPGADKMRLMSESIRGEGGRIWVYGDSSKTIVMDLTEK